jgi:signal transduction histidine kinase
VSFGVEGQIPLEAEFITRLAWLIRLRWLAILGLGVGLALGWLWQPSSLPWLALLGVTLLIALYNWRFHSYARTRLTDQAGPLALQRTVRFAYVQILLDLLALTALIYLTGGAESPLAVVLLLHAILAGLFLSKQGAVFVVALAALLFASVSGLEYAGVLPHHRLPILDAVDPSSSGSYWLMATVMMALALGLVVYATLSISGTLRGRERELAQAHGAALADCQELETANEQLRTCDAERTRFMTLVTHELRAPINTIHTCVELVLAGYALPDRAREILERINKRTLELSDLISDLLRLVRAREEASRDEGLVLVQPAEVLQYVVQLIGAEADSKHLSLDIDLEADLPPIRAHPEWMKRVWTNLLSNAIKYTAPGGLINVTVKSTSSTLVMTVQDTGIGIAPADQQLIFQEFYRADNARNMCPVGTGLGLSIVQRIVESWGGAISVESELGLGSIFTVLLPRADV